MEDVHPETTLGMFFLRDEVSPHLGHLQTTIWICRAGPISGPNPAGFLCMRSYERDCLEDETTLASTHECRCLHTTKAMH
jgi:hypothetical protein